MVVIESERAKILRDPTRSDILSILSETPMTNKQLATRLNKAPSTILHHLRLEVIKTVYRKVISKAQYGLDKD